MSTNLTELSQLQKDDLIKSYLNEIQITNHKKPFVYVKRENNGDVVFLDNTDSTSAIDIKKYTAKEFEDLFNQILDEEDKKETNPRVTRAMKKMAVEIDDQMEKITALRKQTDRLEAKLEIPLEDNVEKNQDNINQIKEINTQIETLRDKLINNITTLRKLNPNPFEEKPTTETGKFIQEYNQKLQKFVNNLSTSAKISNDQFMDVFNIAIEEPQQVKQTAPPQKLDLGKPQTYTVEDISQPIQTSKIYPDVRTFEMDTIISEVDKLAIALKKLTDEELSLAKILHDHATNQGEKLTESQLLLTLNNSNELLNKMEKTAELIDNHINDLQEKYAISDLEWDQLTEDKQNIKTLKFNDKGLTELPPDPYSKEAKSIQSQFYQRNKSLREIGKTINEETTKLKQLLQEEHSYFEQLKKFDKEHSTIDNFAELERKQIELNSKIIEQQRKLNEQIQSLNNNKITKEEWNKRGQIMSEENLNLFHIEYDETSKKVKDGSLPNRDDFSPLLETLKQKNTQKQAKSNISEPNQPNTVTATQEERKWLRAMRDATIKSLESSGIEIKLLNPKPSWKDKNYTISDTTQKVDIKLSTNSVETKNPTNSNLKAMSAAIAANIFARISKEPPENPKVTLGDCKPPEVAQEFAKQIELALTNLKTQHPNHQDKINTILEKFKTNHSEKVNTASVSLENQENEPRPSPFTQQGKRF